MGKDYTDSHGGQWASRPWSRTMVGRTCAKHLVENTQELAWQRTMGLLMSSCLSIIGITRRSSMADVDYFAVDMDNAFKTYTGVIELLSKNAVDQETWSNSVTCD